MWRSSAAPCVAAQHKINLRPAQACLVGGARQAAGLVDQREHAQAGGAALQPAGRRRGRGVCVVGCAWWGGAAPSTTPQSPQLVPVTQPATTQRTRHSHTTHTATTTTPSQVQAVLVVHKVNVGPGDALTRILLLLPLRHDRPGKGRVCRVGGWAGQGEGRGRAQERVRKGPGRRAAAHALPAGSRQGPQALPPAHAAPAHACQVLLPAHLEHVRVELLLQALVG